METVRLGVIGMGNIGAHHVRAMQEKAAPRCKVTAICDGNPQRMEAFSNLRPFTDSTELIHSGEVDAVIIATPHVLHAPIGVEALNAGLHVLVEKPIAAHKQDGERLLNAHKGTDRILATMFQMRLDPAFSRIRDLVQGGELGAIYRVNWITTQWFRSEAYYASSAWRATWAGEGGGTLLNQAPHSLDLLQWFCGMPLRVRAFCHLGKHHRIEVEDEVTAYLEYENGATGVFIVSTAEAPGTERLEIAGDRGRILYEDGKLTMDRTDVSVSEFNKTTDELFGGPAVQRKEIPVDAGTDLHRQVIENFVCAILDGAALVCPAREGLNSLELANAMLYSSMTGTTVELPLDGRVYAAFLDSLISSSSFKKDVVERRAGDMTKSF